MGQIDMISFYRLGMVLCDFVRQQLPRINSDIDSGAEPGVLSEALSAQTKTSLGIELPEVFQTLATSSSVPDCDAKRILGALGFILTSLESHFQARGATPGYAVRLLAVEPALRALSNRTGLPPYANANTMWLDNPEIYSSIDAPVPLTLTNNRGELWFHDSVRATDQSYLRSIDLLAPITVRDFEIDSRHSRAAIRNSALNLEAVRRRYLSFMEPANETSQWPMAPQFFSESYRAKLVAYPVGRHMGAAANALNLASQVILDYILGTTDEEYAKSVARRFPHMIRTDRSKLAFSMRQPSLADLILDAVGASCGDVKRMSASELAILIQALPRKVRDTIDAYEQLVRTWVSISGVHWRLIDQFLGRSEHGRSGASVAVTRQLLVMRRDHPIASKLLTVSRQLRRNESTI